MRLFYKTTTVTTNNSLLLFVTFSARLGTFREHVSALAGHQYTRFAAASDTDRGFLRPYTIHAPNRRARHPPVDIPKLTGQKQDSAPSNAPKNIADADNFKVHSFTKAMFAGVLTAQETV